MGITQIFYKNESSSKFDKEIFAELGNQYFILNWICEKATCVEKTENNFIQKTLITQEDFENLLSDCNNSISIIENMLARTKGSFVLNNEEILELSLCFQSDDIYDEYFIDEVKKAKEIAEQSIKYYKENKEIFAEIFYEYW